MSRKKTKKSKSLPFPKKTKNTGVGPDARAPRGDQFWLWGYHAVAAALDSRQRRVVDVLVTQKAFDKLQPAWSKDAYRIVSPEEIDASVGPEAVHQGVVALVKRLDHPSALDVVNEAERQCLVALDQVTDPQNVGAVVRSGAVFGVGGIVLPKDNAPQESGVLAKAACGALELVPLCYETNLVRTLENLKKEGFWIVGLAEEGTQPLHVFDWPDKTVVVMGSEDKGMRPSVLAACDYLVRITGAGAFTTLNVSNAAAVCLYSWAGQY